MTAVQTFILLALAIGICIEQSLRIEDDSILQKQIDALRERIERIERNARSGKER